MPNLESGSLLVMMGGGGGLLGTFTKGLSQFLKGILVLGSASVALARGLAPAALGQASTVISKGPPLLGDCGQDFELQQSGAFSSQDL